MCSEEEICGAQRWIFLLFWGSTVSVERLPVCPLLKMPALQGGRKFILGYMFSFYPNPKAMLQPVSKANNKCSMMKKSF